VPLQSCWLLSLHQVSTCSTPELHGNDDEMFRFCCSRFIHWALCPPGTRPTGTWACGEGLRSWSASSPNCPPADMIVNKSKMKMVEINFLCIHKLRSKRLAPVLIRRSPAVACMASGGQPTQQADSPQARGHLQVLYPLHQPEARQSGFRLSDIDHEQTNGSTNSWHASHRGFREIQDRTSSSPSPPHEQPTSQILSTRPSGWSRPG
jgi:hypothetical protein